MTIVFEFDIIETLKRKDKTNGRLEYVNEGNPQVYQARGEVHQEDGKRDFERKYGISASKRAIDNWKKQLKIVEKREKKGGK